MDNRRRMRYTEEVGDKSLKKKKNNNIKQNIREKCKDLTTALSHVSPLSLLC